MNDVVRHHAGSILLSVQPRLDHRARVGLDVFPLPATFEALGGRVAIARLVDGLYDRIEADNVLRPAFGRDLAGEREKLKRMECNERSRADPVGRNRGSGQEHR